MLKRIKDSAHYQNFIKYQPLLQELVARDIKIKYRRSVLGVLWTLLNPLFMMIILAVVFSQLFRFDIEHFPLYLLSGQLVFNFFSDTTTTSMTTIIDGAPLIKKIYIPKYLLVLARVIASLLTLMASFTALIIVMLVMRAPLHYTVFLVFIPIILIVMFSLGVGMFLSGLNKADTPPRTAK
jgi:ABC-type polysaccharide/polyol phosphate export permease